MVDDNNQSTTSELQTQAKKLLNDRREIAPGISRGIATRYVLGLLAYTVVICGMTFLVTSIITGTQEARVDQQEATVVAIQSTREARTEVAATETQSVIAATATAFASITPTATQRESVFSEANRAETATPTPTATQEQVFAYPTPPASLSGTIVGWGGRNPQRDDYLDLRYYDPGAVDSYEELGRDFVRYVTASNNLSRFIYSGFSARTGDISLYVQQGDDFTQDGQLITLAFQQTGFVDVQQGALSNDGRFLVFVAERIATGSTDVYRYDYSLQRLERLTNSEANTEYSDPAISADGSQVIVVRTTDGVTDLVSIAELPLLAGLPENVTPTPSPVPEGISPAELGNPSAPLYETLTITAITNNGNEVIEALPSIAADSSQITYAGRAEDAPANHDIYLLPFGAQPIVLSANPDADEIHPVFSPDGQYVAYASNQLDTYNILVQQISSSETYQITTGEMGPHFPGDWVMR